MNENELFDDITRTVGSGMRRRQVIKGILGVLGSAALANLGIAPNRARAAAAVQGCCRFFIKVVKPPENERCLTTGDDNCPPKGFFGFIVGPKIKFDPFKLCCGDRPAGNVVIHVPKCFKPSEEEVCCQYTNTNTGERPFADKFKGSDRCKECFGGTATIGGKICLAGPAITDGVICCPKDTDCCRKKCCSKMAEEHCCTNECCPKDSKCKKAGGCCLPCPASNTGRISAMRSGPPAQADATVQNAVDGISTIAVAKAVNCAVAHMPMQCGGTKSPVVATATKVDQTKPAQFVLRVCTPDGCCCPVDPIFTTLNITTGRWVRQTFTDIPQAESHITVTNGDPGLKKLRIRVNSKHYKTLKLKDNQIKTLNVASAMDAGDHNTISLIGKGELGASADVAIVDSPVSASTALVVENLRGAAFPAEIHRFNTVWGPLAEEVEETSDLRAASVSTQTIRFTFSGALDTAAASNAGLYTVEVNDQAVVVETATAQRSSQGIELTLQLPFGVLQTGDRVGVFWGELLDAKGRPFAGHVSLRAQHIH